MLLALFLSGIRSSLPEGCDIFGLCRSDLGNKNKNRCNNLVYYKTVLPSHKRKAIPSQAWTGPEGSRKWRLPDFKTIGT